MHIPINGGNNGRNNRKYNHIRGRKSYSGWCDGNVSELKCGRWNGMLNWNIHKNKKHRTRVHHATWEQRKWQNKLHQQLQWKKKWNLRERCGNKFLHCIHWSNRHGFGHRRKLLNHYFNWTFKHFCCKQCRFGRRCSHVESVIKHRNVSLGLDGDYFKHNKRCRRR